MKNQFYAVFAFDCLGQQRFFSDSWKTATEAVKIAKQYKRSHLFHTVIVKKQVSAPEGYFGLYWKDFREITR